MIKWKYEEKIDPEKLVGFVEQWQKIKGFPYYLISSEGKVKSITRNVWNGKAFHLLKETILSGRLCGRGYLAVTLRKGKNSYQKYIHRLLADAFLCRPKGKFQVNHKDGDKTNNNILNLEWVTHKENIEHSYKNRIHPSGENHYNSKIKNKEIKIIKKLYSQGLTLENLSKRYNVCFQTIHAIIKNKTYKRI